MNLSTAKLMLLQTRPDITKDQEYKCILDILDIKPSQLKQLDAYTTPVDFSMLEGYDGLIVGGDGAHSVLDDHHFLPPVVSLLKACYDHSFPVFGICFGLQLMAQALGGKVVDDPLLKEVQTISCSLTDAGKVDPIFKDMPEQFLVHAFHNQSVVSLPADAVVLCTGPKAINYCARFGDKKFYGTQFHMEMNKAVVSERLKFYLHKYLGNSDEAHKQAMQEIQEIGPAMKMLTNFVEML